jgi:hypothetical protein
MVSSCTVDTQNASCPGSGHYGVLKSHLFRPPTRRTLVGIGSDVVFRWVRVTIDDVCIDEVKLFFDHAIAEDWLVKVAKYMNENMQEVHTPKARNMFVSCWCHVLIGGVKINDSFLDDGNVITTCQDCFLPRTPCETGEALTSD